jgi:hypothetical protein
LLLLQIQDADRSQFASFHFTQLTMARNGQQLVQTL